MKNDFNYIHAELLADISNGNEESFEKLVDIYKRKIYNLAFSMTGDRVIASDICQETFIVIWNKIRSLKDKNAFEGWLYRIVFNLSKEHFRKKWRENKFFDFYKKKSQRDQSINVADNNLQTEQDKELSGKIDVAINKLSFTQKEVFILKHQEGLKISEIAKVLRCREGTVKSHLFRAVHHLREQLNDVKM